MKQLLYIVIACLVLTACQKENIQHNNTNVKVLYLRVKQVSAAGDTKYSNNIRLVRSQWNSSSSIARSYRQIQGDQF